MPPMELASNAAPAASSAIAALRGAHPGWVLGTLLFAALWLFTLVWGLHRGDARAAAAAPATDGGDAPAASGGNLKQALDRGALGDVAEALCAAAKPRAQDLEEVVARLSDPDQRAAVEALQRARWGGGDGVAARQQLRKAFASGARWRERSGDAPSPLPPLYPPAPDRSGRLRG